MTLTAENFWNYVCLRNEEDELNNLKSRNINNTSKDIYNCGGYALGIFNWFLPYGEENQFVYQEHFKKYALRMVKYMIKLFDGKLRIIKSLDELKENENAIAFRCCSHDFHFMVRKDNKRWYHKRGSCPRIETIQQENVFNKGWKANGLNYNGKLYLLALQK